MPESTRAVASSRTVSVSASAAECAEHDAAEAARARQRMDAVMDALASELYNLASMLVGEGEPCVRLVEKAIDTSEISACQNPPAARKSTRRALVKASVAYLAGKTPEAFAPPVSGFHPVTCIESDDLAEAGLSAGQIEALLAEPGRVRIRQWLERLEPAVRTVFVLRVVAGMDGKEIAAVLAGCGVSRAEGWQTETVRHLFRQGLCSLSSQLLHASTADDSAAAGK